MENILLSSWIALHIFVINYKSITSNNVSQQKSFFALAEYRFLGISQRERENDESIM